MSEISSVKVKTGSSLAITESKTHSKKPGAFFGIFFQLFDWNRKFSKKSNSPNKLLPPAGAKVSKKFNANETLPATKNFLIADENSGGFPSKMKNIKEGNKLGFETKNHELQSPGLVARLMGLEAMPFSVDDGLKNVELSTEKANVRPQKLQKVELNEGRAVTRFGNEALEIKNILSKSKKNQYYEPNLVSPVKSPKMERNGPRLIDVAARVLDPGKTGTNHARCSRNYPSSLMMQSNEQDLVCEVKRIVDMQSEFCPNSSEIRVSNGHCSGCRSCDNIFGRVGVTSVGEEHAPAYRFGERFFHGSDESRRRPAVFLENENDVVLLKTRYQPEYGRPVRNDMTWNDIRQSEIHDQIPLSRIFTCQKDGSHSTGFTSRVPRPANMLLGDRVPQKSTLPNTRSRRVSPPGNGLTEAKKDFIAINRNISQSRLRSSKTPDSRTEANRRFQTGNNDSQASQKNIFRTRRTLMANTQTNSMSSASSAVEKRKSDKRLVPVNGAQNCTTNVSRRVNKDIIRSNVVSFTFNSPVRSSPERKFQNEVEVKVSDRIGSVNEKNVEGINGDALGVLLEQKLKELTRQVENEAAAGFKPSARTSASILQELISALTTDRPDSPGRKDSEFNGVLDRTYQAKSRSTRSSTGLSRGMSHFSPGCILDASFSNESCVSSCIDDNSVKFADLSDSEFSTNQPLKNSIMVVTDLVTHTSAVLEDVNCVHGKLNPTKRAYMQDIILNTELLFGNAGVHTSSRFTDFLLGPFLDELETLVIAAWKNSIILGIEVRKEENPLRRFLLDCLVECLDIRYSRYINLGFRTWIKLPKTVNADILIKEFDEEVRKWISSTGKSLDEMVESEMSASLGKWTDFQIEAFENGVDIYQDIVQSLVDEIVTDLCASELSFW